MAVGDALPVAVGLGEAVCVGGVVAVAVSVLVGDETGDGAVVFVGVALATAVGVDAGVAVVVAVAVRAGGLSSSLQPADPSAAHRVSAQAIARRLFRPPRGVPTVAVRRICSPFSRLSSES